jgi:hypothetical protein
MMLRMWGLMQSQLTFELERWDERVSGATGMLQASEHAAAGLTGPGPAAGYGRLQVQERREQLAQAKRRRAAAAAAKGWFHQSEVAMWEDAVTRLEGIVRVAERRLEEIVRVAEGAAAESPGYTRRLTVQECREQLAYAKQRRAAARAALERFHEEEAMRAVWRRLYQQGFMLKSGEFYPKPFRAVILGRRPKGGGYFAAVALGDTEFEAVRAVEAKLRQRLRSAAEHEAIEAIRRQLDQEGFRLRTTRWERTRRRALIVPASGREPADVGIGTTKLEAVQNAETAFRRRRSRR